MDLVINGDVIMEFYNDKINVIPAQTISKDDFNRIYPIECDDQECHCHYSDFEVMP